MTNFHHKQLVMKSANRNHLSMTLQLSVDLLMYIVVGTRATIFIPSMSNFISPSTDLGDIQKYQHHWYPTYNVHSSIQINTCTQSTSPWITWYPLKLVKHHLHLLLLVTVRDTETNDKKIWKLTRTGRQELTRAWINKMSTQTTPREVS